MNDAVLGPIREYRVSSLPMVTKHYVLQNLPSVVVGHVLGPRPGERILDMCAAPGGKTCHIAALMGDQVRLVMS